ncbi:MAG: DHA2 family efflux MFS transporter permease subunit [Dehalococcoidia bacterium]|jgi:EmrB/QacA subfamily drug resistance transporter|nr:MAG: DHA2 family efflux MFS transporter permease subunit [Dehalococcoidia bacterium]
MSSLPRKQLILTMAGVMLAMFLSSLDQTVVGTAMPRIISDLGGFAHYTWITTAYIITSAVTIPITGKLIDMFGRKPFYIGGLVIFVLASVLCGLAASMLQIIIFRGIQGIGAGVMMAIAFTVIGDLFPPAERGKYQGYMSSMFGLSSIIGPPLGGFITDAFSWHWVFFINVPLGALVIILLLLFFPHIKPDNLKHKVDYPGLATLVLCVVPAMLALSWGGAEYPWRSPEIIGLFIFAAAMLMLFIFIESRSPEPIIPLSLFKNGIVTMSEVVIFITGMGMFGGIIFIPLFFQGVMGASAAQSGSFLTPMMLGIVFGGFISGQLLARAGGHYRLQGTVGIAIMAFGLFLLSRMTGETSSGTAVFNIVVTGFGLGITMPVYVIAIQNAVPYQMLGVATSSGAFVRSLGGSVGLAVFGSIMNNRFGVELATRVPDAVKTAIGPEQLRALANNPEAMFNPEAQARLQSLIEGLGPQGDTLARQTITALRQSLEAAMSEVFAIAVIVVLVGLIVSLFVKEIPLRKQYVMTNLPPEPREK